ncbi:MAG: V-type ATP synthase subunit E [Spirochaetia bacterium]
MDVQLQELIDKIKQDGVKNAEERANEIIEEAKKEADAIVANAQKRSSEIIAEAKSEAAKHQATGEAALRQAGRDLTLTVQKQLEKLFAEIMKTETTEAFSQDILQKAILEVTKTWSSEDAGEKDILVPEDTANELEKGLKGKLSEKLKSGVQLKPFSEIDAGFRVAEKDGSAYYNFTAESIAQALSEYLNPKISELLKEAAKEE